MNQSDIATEQVLRTASRMASAAISAVDLFRDLPAVCHAVILAKSEVQEFSAGHVLFRPGETGAGLFVLEHGHVQTYRTGSRKKLIVSDLKPPAVFGEMGCIGQSMYHCTAETIEPSRIRTISCNVMNELLDKYPQITRRLLDLVSERFLHVLLDLETSSFRPLISRLARLLLENIEGDRVSNMTHKEIAEHLRVYRESATTALGELKQAGIVALERRQIRILDRARLERAARESS